MKNIIIGTAGHIDHGKTTLIKYLTGKDTDTLPEEKKRGITIDLGFGYLVSTDSNNRVGIIDVPGHEKFIKNMVAGITGIDYLILVIAADDGIMPQTKEHFEIAELLGVKKGVIVLTKTDLVSNETIETREKEIRDFVKNSFLENSMIVKTSLKDISIYEKLKNIIITDTEKLKQERENNHNEEENNQEFRMCVDRCFSVKGFGTVVTGTTTGKKISVGETVNIYPLNVKVKIKGIENHGTKVDFIEAGNRGAFNLLGIEKNQIKRGDIISSAEDFPHSQRIDVMFQSLKDIFVKNNQRVRVHLGTREIIGRIRFFGRDEVRGRGRYPAQLLLEEEITGVYGELGLIRNYSPVSTLGGIKILNILGEKTKRDNQEYIEKFLNLDLDKKSSKNLTEYLKNILKEYHENNSFSRGILRAELKNRYFDKISHKDFKELIEKNISEENIKSEKIFEKEYISLKDFKIKLTKEDKKLKDEIFKKYKENMFSPQKYEIFEQEFIKEKFVNEKNFSKIHNYMAEEGMLISLGEDFFILKGFFKEAENKIREFIVKNGKITIGEFRELTKINRKSALLILEKLDNINITRRIDDYRILK